MSSDLFPKGDACPLLSRFGMETVSAYFLPLPPAPTSCPHLGLLFLLHLNGLLWALCSDAAAPDHEMAVALGTSGNWKLEIVPFAFVKHGIPKGGRGWSRSYFNYNCLHYNYNGSPQQEERRSLAGRSGRAGRDGPSRLCLFMASPSQGLLTS